MNEGRTMLGGQHYKIIREDKDIHWKEKVVAIEKGEDLIVSSKLFDTLEGFKKENTNE